MYVRELQGNVGNAVWRLRKEVRNQGLGGSSRELECAVLPVEGEVLHTDGAGGAEDGRWQPIAEAAGVHQHVAVVGHLELGVVAAGITRTRTRTRLRWAAPEPVWIKQEEQKLCLDFSTEEPSWSKDLRGWD